MSQDDISKKLTNKVGDIQYEDYVQPPPTYENITYDNNSLLSKLEYHINNDLIQINSVYDTQIRDAEDTKNKEIKKMEKEFLAVKTTINLERDKEITKYNTEAEKRISELILNMNTREKSIDFFSWILLGIGLK